MYIRGKRYGTGKGGEAIDGADGRGAGERADYGRLQASSAQGPAGWMSAMPAVEGQWLLAGGSQIEIASRAA
jgi:hypothetical protein